jgi:Tfp pilus assembly protein PilF
MTRVSLGLTLAACLAAVACRSGTTRQQDLEQGVTLLAAGEARAAITTLQRAVSADPDWAEARFALGEALAASGAADQASQQFVRAADLLPQDRRVQLKAVAFLILAGHFDDARARAARLAAQAPDDVEVQVAFANALARVSDLDAALAQMNQAIALDPKRSRSQTSLALLRVSRDEPALARAAFERAVSLDSQSVPARLALANFLWSTGDRAGTEQALKAALALDPDSVLTNRALATFLTMTGRAAEAESPLQRVADRVDSAEAWLAIADYFIQERRFDAARSALQRAASRTGSQSGIDVRLAATSYSSGQVADAHRQIDAILAREPNHALALLTKARWLLDEHRPQEALQRAAAAVAANPSRVEAYYARGLAEMRTRRTKDAISSFTEVLRLNARAASAHVHLSTLHLARHAIDSAVLAAEEAVRVAPQSLDAQLALIRAWSARGDAARAAEAIARLKAAHPQSAEVYALDGTLQVRARRFEAARAMYDRALALDDTLLEALIGLVSIDLAERRLGDASAHVNRHLKRDAEDPEVLQLAARVAIASDDRTAAEDLLRRSIVRDPLDPTAFLLLGGLYRGAGQLSAALARFEREATQDGSAGLAAQIMAAMLAHANGQLEDAKRRYREILKREPRAALAGNNLAAILAEEEGPLDVAQQLAEAAAEQLPGRAEIQDTLGRISYRRQLYGLAVLRFEECVALEPRHAPYHLRLGLALARNGQPERARQVLREALALDAALAEARQALAELGQ